MIHHCPDCDKDYTASAGWGLETCPDCFRKSLIPFIKKVSEEPSMKHVSIYTDKGEQIIIKDDKAFMIWQ